MKRTRCSRLVACRAIDLEGSLARTFSEMNEASVRRAWSEEFD